MNIINIPLLVLTTQWSHDTTGVHAVRHGMGPYNPTNGESSSSGPYERARVREIELENQELEDNIKFTEQERMHAKDQRATEPPPQRPLPL